MTKLVTVLIVVAILIIFYKRHHIKFLNAAEFAIVAARQPYFQEMTPADLRARSHDMEFPTPVSYLQWYQSNIRNWTLRERIWMHLVTQAAAWRMRRRGLAQYIPQWRFAKVAQVEEGFPHTLADVIVWSEATLREPFREQVKLAVHEAVHIWQRQNPVATRRRHEARGFTVTDAAPLRRNNPDADSQMWQRGGQLYMKCYRNAEPRGLLDVRGPDHPNEEMAYEIADEATT